MSTFAHLGDGIQLERANAEIAELKRKLAAKKDDGGDGLPDDDADDETGTGDELNPPDDSPTKKNRKVKKKAADEEDEPVENDDRQEKDAAHWHQAFARLPSSASPERILVGIKNRGVTPPTGSAMGTDVYQRHVAVAAAMIVHCAAVARGRAAPPLPPVGTAARMILDAAAEARGEKLEN